jgi:hypothetical protein
MLIIPEYSENFNKLNQQKTPNDRNQKGRLIVAKQA